MAISTDDFVEGSDGIVESDVNPHIPTPDPFTLHFKDPILEKKFRHYFLLKRLPFVRFTLPILLVAVALLGVSYDIVFVESATVSFYNKVLRYGVGLPAILLFWISTYLGKFYRQHTQTLNVLFALTLGGVNIATAVIGGQPDHGPQMLYFGVVYMFLHLRFLYASLVSWTLFTAFILSARFGTTDPKLGLSAGYMTVCNLALMFACWFAEYWQRLDYSRHFMLRMEEQRTNDLLSTLLPERITQKLRDLKYGENLIAEEFSNVSILFSDIVGFTSYCATISSREVINFLNVIYTTFDHLTVIHQVLKVETIGDAYFVASGVLEQRADHADLLAYMAFDMGYILEQFKCKDGYKLQVRIGIHCGRVIAGVVGLKVPRYHLFGDCVTIASLMESTGVPSRIQVSEPFYEQLKDKPQYIFELRTDPDPDGKRKNMKTFFLTPSDADGEDLFIDGNATSNPDPDRPIDSPPPPTRAELRSSRNFMSELEMYEPSTSRSKSMGNGGEGKENQRERERERERERLSLDIPDGLPPTDNSSASPLDSPLPASDDSTVNGNPNVSTPGGTWKKRKFKSAASNRGSVRVVVGEGVSSPKNQV